MFFSAVCAAKKKKFAKRIFVFFFCRVFSFCLAWPSPFDKGQGWAKRQHICLIIYLITRQHDALLLLPRLHLGVATARAKAKAATTTFHRSDDACQGCVRILCALCIKNDNFNNCKLYN